MVGLASLQGCASLLLNISPASTQSPRSKPYTRAALEGGPAGARKKAGLLPLADLAGCGQPLVAPLGC
jgi:hypothetical protein